MIGVFASGLVSSTKGNDLAVEKTSSTDQRWQFWIDVGGTFTDCLANSPHGLERDLKILSSGRTKLRGRFQNPNCILVLDDGLAAYPNHFFESATVSISLNDASHSIGEVVEQTDGILKLTPPSTDNSLPDELVFELESPVPAPVLAIHRLLGIPLTQELPPCNVFLGTTKGTNALLTRSGARTALVTTVGFKDLLEIGDQTRPHLFELTIRKPCPLYERAIQINERVRFDGTVEQPVVELEVRSQLAALRRDGIESIAICFMNAYRNPLHEQQVGRMAKEIGFVDVRISSEIAPLIKIIPRCQTTVLDAYLHPVINQYLKSVESCIGEQSRLKLVTSTGSLTNRQHFSGKDSVLSGPAAGAIGSARVAQQLGFEQSIGFDMGGTSTDVSRFDGQFELEYESRKAGVTLITPVMAIETVAAGGGSVCGFDGTRLTVGPDSAGSDPGPACYGRGGPLTVTDVNRFLGRIDEARFPFELDLKSVNQRLDLLKNQLAATGLAMSRRQIAAGILQIANHNMALAISNVSVKKGYDVREYPLVSFGGAAGQHCCGVADELGMETDFGPSPLQHPERVRCPIE